MTEDEADAKVAALFDEITEVKMINGKPMVSDEQTIRDMEAAKEMESRHSRVCPVVPRLQPDYEPWRRSSRPEKQRLVERDGILDVGEQQAEGHFLRSGSLPGEHQTLL